MLNNLQAHAAHLLVALKKTIPAVLLLGSLSLIPAPSAKAQITVQFIQVGTDILINWELAGNTVFGAPTDGPGSSFELTALAAGNLYSTTSTANHLYLFAGSGENHAWTADYATARSGDQFAFHAGSEEDYIILPVGYSLVSGEGLSGSLTYANSTFTALGFASNEASSGMFNVAGTTVTWSTVAASAVPEPGSYASIVALSALGLSFFRRRPNQRKNLGQ